MDKIVRNDGIGGEVVGDVVGELVGFASFSFVPRRARGLCWSLEGRMKGKRDSSPPVPELLRLRTTAEGRFGVTSEAAAGPADSDIGWSIARVMRFVYLSVFDDREPGCPDVGKMDPGFRFAQTMSLRRLVWVRTRARGAHKHPAPVLTVEPSIWFEVDSVTDCRTLAMNWVCECESWLGDVEWEYEGKAQSNRRKSWRPLMVSVSRSSTQIYRRFKDRKYRPNVVLGVLDGSRAARKMIGV